MIDIVSPKSGFIVRLHKDDGSHVDSDQLLIEIEVDKQARDRARIAAVEAIRVALSRRLSPEQLAVDRRIAELAVVVAKEVLRLKSFQLEKAQTATKLGAQKDLIEEDVAVSKAAADLDIATSQLKRFDYQHATYSEVNAVLEQQLRVEGRYLDAQMSRLSIKSPKSGHVILSASVYEGAYIKRAQLICKIK